jgi:hypothetical protein
MKTLDKQTLIGKIFLGEVLDVNDPDKEGRCKIKIFGMFNSEDPVINDEGKPTGEIINVELPIEDIPWAIPANGKFFAGGESLGFGDISIPKVGSIVKVIFPSGDLYAPEWTAIQNLNIQAIEEIQDTYEGSHIMLYDNDEEVKVFYTPGKGFNIFHKESQIIVNPDSSITIHHKESQSIIELIGNKINITAQGEINMTAQNKVLVTAPQVIVDSNDIKLGENAIEHIIKGDAFKKFYDTHTHAGIGGPPIVPLPPNVFSKISKTV